jgi:predicted unusual protein kinase regulating ubiquinone biosynthesis (AarF/ABC1/UbiB family)
LTESTACRRGSYDPIAARAFFSDRPFVVGKRALAIWRASNTLVLGLLYDRQTDQLEKNEKMRAKGILDILTVLGPTFIKIGQTLSIRPDIIPQVLGLELRVCGLYDNNKHAFAGTIE